MSLLMCHLLLIKHLGVGRSMHRLHNAAVLSAASDSDFELDERLAMLFEGLLGGSDGG